MEFLSQLLPIIIYFLLIIIIIVGIILGIKLIITMTKVESLIDDVSEKVSTLNKVFDVADMLTNKFSMITDNVIGFVGNWIGKLFNKKSVKYKEEDYE